MIMLCPEGVQNKCPGGVWCRGFMSWGDTMICVISRGVQLFYGIAQFTVHKFVGYTLNNHSSAQFTEAVWLRREGEGGGGGEANQSHI